MWPLAMFHDHLGYFSSAGHLNACWFLSFFRPPEHEFRRAFVLPRMFFSSLVLRGPTTNRPETLPHGPNLAEFYNPTPKIRGGAPPKKFGAKTCKISVNFEPLQTLIGNISGTAEDTQNRPALQTIAIPPAFNEKGPVNFGPLTAWNYMWVWTHQNALFWHTISRPLGGAAPWNLAYFGPQTKKLLTLIYAHPNGLFSGDYTSALRGCSALKFLHTLEIGQGLLAHTRRGTPPTQKKSWKLKICLKIQRSRVHNFRNSGSIFTKLFHATCHYCEKNFVFLKMILHPDLRRRAASRLALPCSSSFFFSPRVLRAPSTDRPETFPRDRNLAVFYNPAP